MIKLPRHGLLGSPAITAAAAQFGYFGAASVETMRAAKLFYTDAGKGRNLMLLHGWVADSHDWSWQIPILEKRYRTIAVDLRGHGRSEVMPSGQYQPKHYVLDIISLIETDFAGQKFTLIGHSMGGQIAARIAALRPDLVDAVISVDGSLGFDDQFTPLFQETSDRLQTENPVSVTLPMIENFYDPATSPALKTWHARRMMGMSLAPFRESFGPLFLGAEQVGVGAGSEALLKTIGAPFYHLCRFNDQAERMRGWFTNPQSKAEMWEHASHWIMQDRPDDVNAAIVAWLDGM
ncbi:alpha/beta fold hydrolase [Sodalis sp. RH21]|uniref:alpha/beta fold hydrolase n=1 Tax=unclassified Sodalis (in: enterobacteria) TaxID=2636512 RepID=UPI0039B677B0